MYHQYNLLFTMSKRPRLSSVNVLLSGFTSSLTGRLLDASNEGLDRNSLVLLSSNCTSRMSIYRLSTGK